MREPIFDFPGNGHIVPAHQSLEPAGKIIFSVGLGHKVQYGETILPLVQTEPTAQLLEKYGHTVGRPQEQDGVDAGNIHPFVEQVYYENKGKGSAGQLLTGALPFLIG